MTMDTAQIRAGLMSSTAIPPDGSADMTPCEVRYGLRWEVIKHSVQQVIAHMRAQGGK